MTGLFLALLGASFSAQAQSLRISRDMVLQAEAPEAVNRPVTDFLTEVLL